jgi:Kip1 ubiquitination-promoting complex protein 1
MSFLRYLVCKNKGAARNVPPPGLSDNSVLMTVYTVLLRFLSEGYAGSNIRTAGKAQDLSVPFLHRGGERAFSMQLFLDADSYIHEFARLGGTFSHLCKARALAPDDYDTIVWEEGCMEEESDRKVTHLGKQKPGCCSGTLGSSVSCNKESVRVLNKGYNIHVSSVSENSGTSRPEHSRRNCTEDEEEKPSSSGRVDLIFRSPPYYDSRNRSISKAFSSDTVREEELLDIMVLLYHLGVAPNFKQVIISNICLSKSTKN